MILATEQLWTGKGINMATKSEIRRDIKAFKHDTDSMMIDFAGEVIGYKILALDEYKKADIIFIYADYNKEVKTETIIKDALKNGKKVALPRVYKHDIAIDSNSGKYMKFHYIESMDDLEKGYSGIREPKEDLKVADSDTADNALMIMPMVAFDGDRNRVGYGGGFYDKYLESHSFSCKIGIAYEEQKVEAIDDKDEHDIRPDVIVTEKNIYR